MNMPEEVRAALLKGQQRETISVEGARNLPHSGDQDWLRVLGHPAMNTVIFSDFSHLGDDTYSHAGQMARDIESHLSNSVRAAGKDLDNQTLEKRKAVYRFSHVPSNQLGEKDNDPRISINALHRSLRNLGNIHAAVQQPSLYKNPLLTDNINSWDQIKKIETTSNEANLSFTLGRAASNTTHELLNVDENLAQVHVLSLILMHPTKLATLLKIPQPETMYGSCYVLDSSSVNVETAAMTFRQLTLGQTAVRRK